MITDTWRLDVQWLSDRAAELAALATGPTQYDEPVDPIETEETE